MNSLNLCRLRFFATDIQDIDVDQHVDLDWAKWLSPLKMATPNPDALRKLFISGSFQAFRTIAVDYGPSLDGLAAEDAVFREMEDAFYVEPASMQSPEFFQGCGMPAFDIVARKTQSPEAIVRAETRSSMNNNLTPPAPSSTSTGLNPTGLVKDKIAAHATSYGLVPIRPRAPIIPKVKKKGLSYSFPSKVVSDLSNANINGYKPPNGPETTSLMYSDDNSSSHSACLGPISDSDVDTSSSTES